jgi:hypothetical protein
MIRQPGSLKRLDSLAGIDGRANPSPTTNVSPTKLKRKPVPVFTSTGSSMLIPPAFEERHRNASQSSKLSDLISERSFGSASPQKGNTSADMMKDEDIAAMLEEMMDKMGLDEEKRDAIRRMPKENKFLMVHQHVTKEQGKKAVRSKQSRSPLYFIDSIRSYLYNLNDALPMPVTTGHGVGTVKAAFKNLGLNASFLNTGGTTNGNKTDLEKLLNSLRVSLQTESIDWVQTFVHQNGVDALLDLLSHVHDATQKKDMELLTEQGVVRCLKSLMNNKYGLLEMFLKAPRSIEIITQSILSENFFVRKMVVELLTVICYTNTPTGWEHVMSAFRKLALTSVAQSDTLQLNSRVFEEWMNKLRWVLEKKDKNDGGIIAGVGWIGNSKVTDRDISDFLLSNIILINALISIPSHYEMRIHVRNMFQLVGFGFIKEKLHEASFSNEYLKRQIVKYDNDSSKDWQTMLEAFQNISNEESDPNVITRNFVRQIEGTRGLYSFTSILRHLLLIRQDVVVRNSYLQLIDEIVSQIVLDGKGMDPDFSTIYPINLKSIIDNFVSADDLLELRQENRLLAKSVEKLKDEKAALMQELKNRECTATVDVKTATVVKLQEEIVNLKCIIEYIKDNRLPTVSKEDTFFATEKESTTTVLNEVTHAFQESIAEIEKDQITASLSDLSFAPPPPPPPPGAPQMMTRKAKAPIFKSKAKLKPLKIEKIPDHKINSTVWADYDEALELEEKLKKSISWNELEDAFSFTSNQPKVAPVKETKNKKELLEEFSVISSKKSYNIKILLGRVKVTLKEFEMAFQLYDESILNQSLVSQLCNYLPTSEEVAALAPFLEDEPPNLSGADRFLLMLIRVDRSGYKLKYLSFKYEFEDHFGDFEASLMTIKEATSSIKTSKAFKTLIRIILSFSNVMNSQGFRSGAFGLKLGSLNNLIETKSETGESFLNYLARIMNSKFPEVLSIFDDLESIARASKISLEHLKTFFSQLQSKYTNLCRHVKNQHLEDISSLFLRKISKRISNANSDLQEILAMFEDVVTYYGDEPNDVTSESWFGDISSFLISFRSVFKASEVTMSRASSSVLISSVLNTRTPSPVASEASSMQNKIPDLREGKISCLCTDFSRSRRPEGRHGQSARIITKRQHSKGFDEQNKITVIFTTTLKFSFGK